MIKLTLSHTGRALFVRPESVVALVENFTEEDFINHIEPVFRNTLVFLGGTENETFCVQERAVTIAYVLENL